MRGIMVLLSAVLLANQVRASSIIFGEEEWQPLVFEETPECARNPTGVCLDTNVKNYPKDVVRRALANANDAAITDITRGDEVIANETLGNRFGGSVHDDNTLVEETAVCAASEEIIYPTMAMNTKKQWLYVANLDTMTQGIRVEKCLDEGKQCKIGGEGTICRQKYIYRKLLAVNANRNLETDNFRIPSTCVCYIKNAFLLSTRLKAGGRNSTKAAGSRKRRGHPAFSGRSRRQAPGSQLGVNGAETEGLSGSPLDNTLTPAAPEQNSVRQSIETEQTKTPSDTLGDLTGRFAGEIIVESNPIVVEKKPPKSRRRN